MYIYIYESGLRIPRPPPNGMVPQAREHGTRDHTYIHACMHASIDPSIHPSGCIHPDASIYPSIHPYIHPYIHTYLRTYIHTHRHTYLSTYLHTYIPTYLRTYVPTYLRTHVHTYIHACMHGCIHTYLPTYLPTYIHTYNIPTYQHTNIPPYHHHRPQGGGPEEPYHHHRPQGGGTRRTIPPSQATGGGPWGGGGGGLGSPGSYLWYNPWILVDFFGPSVFGVWSPPKTSPKYRLRRCFERVRGKLWNSWLLLCLITGEYRAHRSHRVGRTIFFVLHRWLTIPQEPPHPWMASTEILMLSWKGNMVDMGKSFAVTLIFLKQSIHWSVFMFFSTLEATSACSDTLIWLLSHVLLINHVRCPSVCWLYKFLLNSAIYKTTGENPANHHLTVCDSSFQVFRLLLFPARCEETRELGGNWDESLRVDGNCLVESIHPGWSPLGTGLVGISPFN